MKKSHKWDIRDVSDIRCPHCGKWLERDGAFMVGDDLLCDECGKMFELGQQK